MLIEASRIAGSIDCHLDVRCSALAEIALARADQEPSKALELLTQAEQTAEVAESAEEKFLALIDLARAYRNLDASQGFEMLERALSLADVIDGTMHYFREMLLVKLAGALVAHNPGDRSLRARAEEVTERIPRNHYRDQALEAIATATITDFVIRTTLLTEAVDVAQQIVDAGIRAETLYKLVLSVVHSAPADPETLRLAYQLTGRIEDPEMHSRALVQVATACADFDRTLAGTCIEEAEQLIRSIPTADGMARALATLAEFRGVTDPARALEMLRMAEQLVDAIRTNATAATRTEVFQHIIQSLMLLAVSNSALVLEAERVAGRIQWPESERERTLVWIASALLPADSGWQSLARSSIRPGFRDLPAFPGLLIGLGGREAERIVMGRLRPPQVT
jgi:hypothetical protein